MQHSRPREQRQPRQDARRHRAAGGIQRHGQKAKSQGRNQAAGLARERHQARVNRHAKGKDQPGPTQSLRARDPTAQEERQKGQAAASQGR